MKTLLEIISIDFRAAGNRGSLTREFIATWRAENPPYAKAMLSEQFKSGSTVPVKGQTRLDRAMKAWLKAGNPSPGKPEFDGDAFNQFVAGFVDEFEESYYR